MIVIFWSSRPVGLHSDQPVASDSHGVLDDVRVDPSNPVDGMRPHHAQVSHIDPLGVALLDQGHAAQAVGVAGEHGCHPLRGRQGALVTWPFSGNKLALFYCPEKLNQHSPAVPSRTLKSM